MSIREPDHEYLMVSTPAVKQTEPTCLAPRASADKAHDIYTRICLIIFRVIFQYVLS